MVFPKAFSLGWLSAVCLAGALPLVAQTKAANESSRWQRIYVDDRCYVLSGSDELKPNTDVCTLEGMGVHRSNHVAAKEVDGIVQHSRVDVAEQTYLLQNIHSQTVVFVVANQVPEGWHVDSDPQPKAMKENLAVFEAIAEPGQIVRLHVGIAHETPLDYQP